MSTAFPYSGDPALLPAIEAALKRVIDPEMALDVVNMGLVYGVGVGEDAVDVRLTMTSAACPVAELIVEDVGAELAQVLPDHEIRIALCWEPPWGPERMSERARAAMAWD